MIVRTIRRFHRDQRGFTLIELLVVITVLGILAAIVSISLLGVTSKARENAKRAELQTVQQAFDAMLQDQHIPGVATAGTSAPLALVGCAPVDGYAKDATGQRLINPLADTRFSYTNQMDRFPSTAKLYAGSDTGDVTVLATHYTRQIQTQYQYACDAFGNVFQK